MRIRFCRFSSFSSIFLSVRVALSTDLKLLRKLTLGVIDPAKYIHVMGVG
jgi:hypothetical protein